MEEEEWDVRSNDELKVTEVLAWRDCDAITNIGNKEVLGGKMINIQFGHVDCLGGPDFKEFSRQLEI